MLLKTEPFQSLPVAQDVVLCTGFLTARDLQTAFTALCAESLASPLTPAQVLVQPGQVPQLRNSVKRGQLACL